MFEILAAVLMTAFTLAAVGLAIGMISWGASAVVDLVDRVDYFRRYRGER